MLFHYGVKLEMVMLKNFFSWFNVLLIVIGVVIGLIVGWYLFAPKNEITKVVTSQTVLDRVTEMGFLVTRSILIDQTAETKIDQGSDWSNFWWGYSVNSRALMRANIGVDLLQVQQDDIKIDQVAMTICVIYPNATISSIELEGDIEVETNSGLLKRILDNNTERDYNLALTQLREETEKAIQSDTELLKVTRESADAALKGVLVSTGYSINANCR